MITPESIHTLFDTQNPLTLVTRVVAAIRPRSLNDGATAAQNLSEICQWLEDNPAQCQQLSGAVFEIVSGANLQYVYSESGLLTGSGFFAELSQKLNQKILPPLLDEKDLRFAIRTVFNRSLDYRWLQAIPESGWLRLFRLLDVGRGLQEARHIEELLKAGDILSFRIANLGFDEHITQRAHDVVEPVNAFVEQHKSWQRFRDIYAEREISTIDIHPYSHMLQSIDLGYRQIRAIRRLKRVRGTGLQQTFILERLEQHLKRLEYLITILDPRIELSPQSYLAYFLQVVESENTQHKVRAFLSSTLSYLAYQISEHGSRTGEKYITSNRLEYWQFFQSAAIGGFIISFAALLKVMLTHLQLPYFWASFSYGINYATAFVIIHLMHGTIATKQPALTASTVANALDTSNSQSPGLYNLALLVGKVFRSQLASLLGNLVVVFPLTIALAWLHFTLSGQDLIPAADVAKTIGDIRLGVGNIWFAGVAGFLLFFSGIVSGYFDNKVIYASIPLRLKKSRKLNQWLGDAKLERMAAYIDKNLGAIMGNIILGFGLGYMIFFGKIFGLPLDIRHVTISTGFFGFITWTTGFQMFWQTTLWCVIGLAGIALTNLLVSFALALYVAMKSRRISGSQLWPLLKLSVRYLVRYPVDFIYPPRKERSPGDLGEHRKAA